MDKAGALKPGSYNLYLAEQSDKTKRYDGVIVHVDSNHPYQQIEKKFVLYSRNDFDSVPAIGNIKSISYNDKGKAVVSSEAVKIGRSRSR